MTKFGIGILFFNSYWHTVATKSSRRLSSSRIISRRISLYFEIPCFQVVRPFNFVCGISQMTKSVARALSFCLAYDGKAEVASDTTWSRTSGFEDFSSLQVFDTLRVILTFYVEYRSKSR